MSYYYDYDEFYNEPSEFERQVGQFKQSLIEAVKREHKDEVDRLRKENTELQEIKKRKKEIEQDHKNALSALNREKQEFERKTKQARLDELLGECWLQGWIPRI